MRIPDNIYQTNKTFFITFQPENTCKLEFAYCLWLPFLHQFQSEILVFAMITFHMDNTLVQKWKHGIGPNYIISFNEIL